ncbi:hypothetical protein BDZ91DRAFT_799749 [Kalaharituber pfeilii]|nr:hypothetical protein BDZ91DRAFT_799749 [Kalaharituber pfeilii]
MAPESIAPLQQKPAEPLHDSSTAANRENEALKSDAHGLRQQGVKTEKLVQHKKARCTCSESHLQNPHCLQEPTPLEDSRHYSKLTHDVHTQLGEMELLPMERLLLLNNEATDEGWNDAYTDGCRIEEKAGAGTYIQGKRHSLHLGTRATVNDAELIAISMALETQDGQILILTDSKVAVAKLRRIAEGQPNYEGASQKGTERSRATRFAIALRASKKKKKGNSEADKAAKIGAFLQYQTEIITEGGRPPAAAATQAGMRQEAKKSRAEERNRLGMNYRPLQRLGRAVAPWQAY